MTRPGIDMFILDSLANDLEDVGSILRILNSASELGWRDQHPEPFTREEVVPALLRAVKRKEIEACVYRPSERALVGAGEGIVPQGSLDEVWFRLTERGRIVLKSWTPPPLPGDQQA